MSTAPSVEIINLSPQIAHEFLQHNTDNYRRVVDREVSTLAQAMRRGEFDPVVPSNDAVAFSAEGVLINGQHRCLAVIRSGVTIPVMVIRGGTSDLADKMDSGRKRTATTVLQRHGFADAATLGSIIRNYQLIVTGRRDTQLTTQQILLFAEKHRAQLENSISWGRKAEKAPGVPLPKSIGGSVYLALSQADLERADEFFARLIDGAGLYPGNGIFALRRRLDVVLSPHRRSLDRFYVSAITVKAWNAWYSHRTIHALKWRGANAPEEEFPKVQGLPMDGLYGFDQGHRP